MPSGSSSRTLTLKEEWVEAIEAWAEEQTVTPSRARVIYKALQRFFEEEGFDYEKFLSEQELDRL